MKLSPPKTWKMATALSLSWILLASPAGAVPSVDLFFSELNGSSIGTTQNLAVLPGDRVGVEMVITGDDRGVVAYSLSVDFDSGGDGRILLEDYATVLALGFEDILGPGPQGPDDSLGAPGMVRLFAATSGFGPGGLEPNPFTENASFTVATLEFTITDEILGGPATIAPGLFHTGVDEILSNDVELIGSDFQFVDVSADYAFTFATLTIVPEPATGLLLAGGLLVLARVRRRR